MKTKQQYLYNALLAAAVTLLMRTVGVAFNVYISGRVGAEAMGLLSLVGGVYSFAVTLGTSGIHLATVRTLSERLKRSGGAENRKCLKACLSYAAFFGTLATVLLFLLAKPIGLYLLKDTRTVRALTMLSFTLLPIAISAVFNGYFTAVRRAYKNAIAQISEQAVKITFTSYLLSMAAPKSTEGGLIAILMGGAVAEALTLLLNLMLFLIDKRRYKGIKQQKNTSPVRVAAVALPVAISAYMRSGLLTIEHILIPRGLSAYGAGSAAALAAYGTLQGMALPVILYPAAILSSFSALLIPEITEQQTINNRREICYIAGRAYQVSLLFSIGTAAVMLFLSGELGTVLYNSSEVGYFIKCLAPLIPIMYLDTATDALLKGLGEQVYSMNVNIADALLSVVLVFFLVPRIGIHGYVVTIYVTEIFNAALSIARLLHVSSYRPRPVRLLLLPLLSAVGAAAVANIFFHYVKVPQNGGGLTAHVLGFVIIYVILLILTGTLPRQDLKWLKNLFFCKQEPTLAEKG
ncbi:MAG: hypothetical protein E7639_01785 [Ruminococcaceae bacterium]|nr:hypothetical protein [Oscillospiraceae bacterium]